MATINLVIDFKRPKKDMTCNIKLQVRHKNTNTQIATSYSVLPKYWDGNKIKRNCPNVYDVRAANKDLIDLLSDAEDCIDKLHRGQKLDHMSARQIAEYIKKGGSTFETINFLEYLESYISKIPNASTREKYQSTLTILKDYSQTSFISFDDINKPWLYRFKEWRMLKSSPATANIDLRNIRALFNRAIDVDEIIGQELYPFRRFEFAKSQPRNLRLPVETIRKIRDFKTDYEPYALARDFFMLSFYLIGMNNSDIFSIKSVEDGRIEYDRRKTNKYYSIKAEPEALEVIQRRKGKDKLLIYQERYANYRNLTKQMNKHLKEIGKNDKIKVPDLKMYHARHSWAGIAAKKPIGAGKPLIAQALGHGKKTVTDSYFDYDFELVDDLNRKVLDLLKRK